VVVYFYPSAYTGGCNLEAHTFAVQHEKFLAAGATIVGVSLDDIGRLNTFSADPEYCGGKIAVASDPTATSRAPTRSPCATPRPAARTRAACRSSTASPSAAPSS
jgi:hypothetical protein